MFKSLIVSCFLSLTLMISPLTLAKEVKGGLKGVSKEFVVNINTANAEEMQMLVGVGEQKSKAIVEYREKHGKFKSINGLTKVVGIGPSIVENNRDKLTLGKAVIWLIL